MEIETPTLRRRRAPTRHAALPFDIAPAKLRVPEPRPGSIARTALVNRLRGARSQPLVTLTAPAGYGKSTALAQWAARDGRAFAWVSLEEGDGEPLALLRLVGAALHGVAPLPRPALEALAGPRSAWTRALTRLAGAITTRRAACVVVLDNASILRSKSSARIVAAVADHLPEGSTLALAGRSSSSLPLAVRRAAGHVLELGPGALTLTRREAELLVRSCGLSLGEGEIGTLLERTGGWPAGLYLGALAISEDGGADFGGDDRYLAEYFRAACLEGASAARLAFLRRSSVLECMSGELCDDALGLEGSAIELEAIEGDGQFLMPLDRRGGWFRYHPLFRDLLRRELDRHEPGAARAIASRASGWFEEHGDLEAAVEHAAAAGDGSRLTTLLCSLTAGGLNGGDLEPVERLVERHAAPNELHGHPGLAAVAAVVHAARGRPASAERWLATAERSRDEGSPDRPCLAVARAMMCPAGPERMLADAEAALASVPAESPWLPTALFLRGCALLLLGDTGAADAAFAETAAEALHAGAPSVHVAALGQRALIALARDDHHEADHLALELEAGPGRRGAGDAATAALVHAAAARAYLRRSRFDEARAELTAAQGLSPLLTRALPWLAVQARLELARAHLALRDAAVARELLDEAAAVLEVRPELGVLATEARRVRGETDELRRGREATSGLTGAELRLLPLLATHLSFREIGERLYLSRHTVKTQAISTYRKLGVSNRSDAIEAAAELGLLDLEGDRAATVA